MPTQYTIDRWMKLVKEQREWIAQCGRNLNGYIAHYGSAKDPEHYGNGGEAIYAADVDVLRQYEEKLASLTRGS
jgi:hypothetical protein